MHEVGLMEQVLAIAASHAERARAQRIVKLNLRVGGLSGVVPDALEFAFVIASKGTMAEGAQLDIESVPVTCECEDCGCRFEADDDLAVFRCPDCGRASAKVLTGRDFAVTSIEVE